MALVMDTAPLLSAFALSLALILTGAVLLWHPSARRLRLWRLFAVIACAGSVIFIAGAMLVMIAAMILSAVLW